ncbi:LOW QUALITY PROTEIN: 52 kDa repressor of the inhibitor of the protein kinase-like [Galleria mellonella]|uniref:LOW QUALITY PROTEIN: 52 kDa repressor of the inhibitor of the protein kinase-like n=1 Tax=Galleria mellonella TaxID=7137 RepID=A0ABM3MS12_GALME|nr:LOW QUALITY PROTEIN: 52 kDa repressor of the inhibitor of the protein kinase-like [Galleria mellonella]
MAQCKLTLIIIQRMIQGDISQILILPKNLQNNEIIQRRWLIYSVSKNRVYCFCCRLFDSSSTSNLASEGYNDWKHLSEMLKVHESSTFHKKFYLSWIEAELRLKTGKTIDCQEQHLIRKETTRWNNILCRLMHITLYLAENNMAFRGTSDKLYRKKERKKEYTPNNGKFLGLVQLLAKFDPIMEEHLRLAVKGDVSDHYCVNRWKILTDHLGLYTIKKLSDTRWEARIGSVKAVRYQISAVHDALITLAIETQQTDVQVSHEATTLAEQLKDFGFIVSLVVWYDILFQINVVSKSLQSTDMDLGKCTDMLKKCCNFLEEYRNTGFKSAILTAKELAEELEIEPVFRATTRIRRVKRQAGETAQDEPITSPEKKIEVEFFNCLLDTTLTSLNEGFEQSCEYSESWSFLYNLKQIPEKHDLIKLCSDLQLKLNVNSKSDIDGCMLCDELVSLKSFLPDQKVVTPVFVLNFIKDRNLQELYPNVWIALRILLTIPVTAASGERSFSKLKLIKTYLRLTISQSRLTNLATLSIENEIAENIDFDNLIKEFADRKARKVKFY